MRLDYAILFVGDMKTSVAFYRDVVGLPLTFESTHWSEFRTGGATLALHVSESPERVGDDPMSMPPGRCRPGLGVPDLDAFHARMVEHLVPCVEEPRERFGSRIAMYLDPDGLAFSVGERAGDP
jgi:catechol 2,3-dioxygenase-like lactoylglutathione lyase family enzyme